MRIFTFICFAFFTNYSFGQYNGNNWCFGDSARIDFISGVPTATQSVVRSRGSCASISDTNGLLFYSHDFAGVGQNSTKIFNNSDLMLTNGDSIVGQAWYNELLAVPFPDHLGQFILLTVGVTMSGLQGLYYSIVDINAQGGFGEVILKNDTLIKNQRMFDGIAAVKHGNGRDWWIVTKPDYYPVSSDTFYVYLISPTGN